MMSSLTWVTLARVLEHSCQAILPVVEIAWAAAKDLP